MDPQQAQKLMSDNPRLRQERDISRKQVVELRKEVEALRTERDRLQNEDNWHRRVTNKLRDELDAVHRSKQALLAQIEREQHQKELAEHDAPQAERRLRNLCDRKSVELRALRKEKDELAQQHDALTKTLEEARQEMKKLNAQISFLGSGIQAREKQTKAAYRELARLQGYTNHSKLRDEEDDDDEDYRESVHHSASNSGSSRQEPVQTRAKVSTSRKRPLEEVEIDQELTTATKRMKTASLEPQTNHARPMRSARIEGEVTRREQQQALETWKFVKVTGYGLSTKTTSKEIPGLSEKVAELRGKWEKSNLGQLWFVWFEDSISTGAKKRYCVQSKMEKKHTHWRKLDNGLFACQDCVKAKIPCFTYDPEHKQFLLLPMHEEDRLGVTSQISDARRWWNA